MFNSSLYGDVHVYEHRGRVAVRPQIVQTVLESIQCGAETTLMASTVPWLDNSLCKNEIRQTFIISYLVM